MKTQRILIATGIFPPEIGGPASYGKILATKLGTNATVLTYSSVWSFKDDKNQIFRTIRVWSKWPIWIKHFIFGIKLIFMAQKHDVIYALNVWSAGFPCLITSYIFKKRFVVRIVGDYAWEVGVGKGKVKLLIDDFQKTQKRGWIGSLHKFQSLICQK